MYLILKVWSMVKWSQKLKPWQHFYLPPRPVEKSHFTPKKGNCAKTFSWDCKLTSHNQKWTFNPWPKFFVWDEKISLINKIFFSTTEWFCLRTKSFCPCRRMGHKSTQGDLYELERQAFEFFGRSEISRDMKKII